MFSKYLTPRRLGLRADDRSASKAADGDSMRVILRLVLTICMLGLLQNNTILVECISHEYVFSKERWDSEIQNKNICFQTGFSYHCR